MFAANQSILLKERYANFVYFILLVIMCSVKNMQIKIDEIDEAPGHASPAQGNNEHKHFCTVPPAFSYSLKWVKYFVNKMCA